jgi:hypothetical protein
MSNRTALTFVALPALAVFAVAGSPLWAGTPAGTTIDEPAALAIMALGVVGLVIGRQAARRKD